MVQSIKVTFISDVSCGWCAVGLHAIEEALQRIGPEVKAQFDFQPFELNPDMPSGGENLQQHLQHKYGEGAAAQYFTATRQHGNAVGFSFNLDAESRIYNTFDAHRLLYWASRIEGHTALTHALFAAHFTENKDPSNHDVLLACVREAQLDVAAAKEVLDSNLYAAEIRQLEMRVQQQGIHAVPTLIIDDRHVISGSRSVATFEQYLRSILSENAKRDDAGGGNCTDGLCAR
jgi:predicted DsbA family dithiol-disulfide isomerase